MEYKYKAKRNCRYIKLPRSIRVPRWVYSRAYKKLDKFLPTMLPDHRYPGETIFGNGLWSNPDFHSYAGYCIADMTRRGLFEIEFGYKGGKSTNMFQLSNKDR